MLSSFGRGAVQQSHTDVTPLPFRRDADGRDVALAGDQHAADVTDDFPGRDRDRVEARVRLRELGEVESLGPRPRKDPLFDLEYRADVLAPHSFDLDGHLIGRGRDLRPLRRGQSEGHRASFSVRAT